jgi:hypothetical protein
MREVHKPLSQALLYKKKEYPTQENTSGKAGAIK